MMIAWLWNSADPSHVAHHHPHQTRHHKPDHGHTLLHEQTRDLYMACIRYCKYSVQPFQGPKHHRSAMNFEAEKEKQSLVTDRNYCILSTKYPAKQLDSLGLMLSV